MGVRFYQCAACEKSLYEEFVGICEGCEQDICCDCLVAAAMTVASNVSELLDPRLLNDEGQIRSKHCPCCLGMKASTSQLLDWLLKIKGLTREQAEREYLKEKKMKGTGKS